MTRRCLRFWAVLLMVASVSGSEGAVPSALARVQEAVTPVLPSHTESPTDTVIAHQRDCAPNSWFCYEGLATMGGALLGSVIGAVAGALVGLAVTPDGWVDIPLPSLEVRTEGARLAFRVPVR